MSHAPSFMRTPAPVRSRRGEWIALVLLALALLAQLFFSQRAQLAALFLHRLAAGEIEIPPR